MKPVKQLQKHKKIKIVNFSFFDKVYRVEYDIYIGERETCAPLLKKKYGVEILDHDNAYGEATLLQQEGQIKIVIWLKSYDFFNLSHECFHATAFVLDYIGVKLNMDTHEQYAYYLEYLLYEITDIYKKATK